MVLYVLFAISIFSYLPKYFFWEKSNAAKQSFESPDKAQAAGRKGWLGHQAGEQAGGRAGHAGRDESGGKQQECSWGWLDRK